jgi:uncharacterized protein (DUF488 family)
VKDEKVIFTIGHSTRTLEAFIAVLLSHRVHAIADVRLIPKSRRYPHFRDDELSRSLPEHGIEYHTCRDLGGRRRPRPDSVNTGWRNESFRGYADYMQTPQFDSALEELVKLARQTRTAIMCAEAVPWRCHRSLIADALLVRGWQVLDIYDERKATPHKLTPFARVDGTKITYPPDGVPSLFAAETSSPPLRDDDALS